MSRHVLVGLVFVAVLGTSCAGRILPNFSSARFADASQVGFTDLATGIMKADAAERGYRCTGPIEVYAYSDPAAITADVNRWLAQRGYRATVLDKTSDQATWKAEGPDTLFGIYGRIGERTSRVGALLLCRATRR